MPPTGSAVSRVTFPGIKQVVSATVTLAHGITPSTFQLSIAPQVIRAQDVVGDLTIQYDSEKITFRDCKINLATMQVNSRGQVIQLEIFDRRWKWAWGAIDGWYNVRIPAGSDNIKQATRKTPTELAKLCLQEMSESRYDLDGFKGATDNPEIDWDGAAPAQALAELAERYNCHVTLTIDDRVAIVPVGTGANLPTRSAMEGELTADVPESPTSLEVRCGKTRYQGDYPLEAVGLDSDGAIKLLDSLSYKPSGGWETADFPYLVSISSARDRELAKRTVFRWYRLKVPLTVPGYASETVTDRDYIELESDQVDSVTVAGVKTAKPADVWGTWCPGTDSLANIESSTTPPAGIDKDLATSGCYRQFSVNTQLNLVDFSDRIFKSANDGTPLRYEPADLYLRTALRFRDRDGIWQRFSTSRKINRTVDTPPRILHHEELVLNYSNGTVTNKSDIEKACKYYLDAAAKEYQASTPQQMRYVGLVRIDVDGAIQQVTWHVGADGTWTQASRNTEHENFAIPYKERRAWEKLAPLIAQSRVGTLPSGVVKLLPST